MQRKVFLQLLHRAAHRQKGGVEDVELVDLSTVRLSDAIGYGSLTDRLEQLLPLFFRKLFGID